MGLVLGGGSNREEEFGDGVSNKELGSGGNREEVPGGSGGDQEEERGSSGSGSNWEEDLGSSGSGHGSQGGSNREEKWGVLDSKLSLTDLSWMTFMISSILEASPPPWPPPADCGVVAPGAKCGCVVAGGGA